MAQNRVMAMKRAEGMAERNSRVEKKGQVGGLVEEE